MIGSIFSSLGAGVAGLANANVDCRIVQHWSTAGFLFGDAVAAGVVGVLGLALVGSSFTAGEMGLLLIAATVSYVAGIGNVWVLTRFPPHQVVFLQQLRPVVALTCAWVAFGQVPAATVIWGLALLVLGTALFTGGTNGAWRLYLPPVAVGMLLLTLLGWTVSDMILANMLTSKLVLSVLMAKLAASGAVGVLISSIWYTFRPAAFQVPAVRRELPRWRRAWCATAPNRRFSCRHLLLVP